ncbi:MAG: hypothetical protein HYY04_06445, partial [Chloroflexi bacterium]|nr:hypothetical protein [Chloroflexota bacterium]
MGGRRDVYQTAMREGHALAWSHKWEAAILKYRLALAEFPDDAAAFISLGVALVRVGRTREALAAYEAARRQRATDATVLARIAELRQLAGDSAGAARAFAELADVSVGHGERDRAREALVRARALAEADMDGLRQVRDSATRGNFPDVQRACEALLALAAPSSMRPPASVPVGGDPSPPPAPTAAPAPPSQAGRIQCDLPNEERGAADQEQGAAAGAVEAGTGGAGTGGAGTGACPY